MSTPGPQRDELARLFSGDGEMAGRMRALDWAATPLGSPETWPQALRSAVVSLLVSKAQIVFVWGDDLITFYNDAYRPVLGVKHPDALGKPVRDVWSEIWLSGLLRKDSGLVGAPLTEGQRAGRRAGQTGGRGEGQFAPLNPP
jgi:PAS domain-containing protein